MKHFYLTLVLLHLSPLANAEPDGGWPAVREFGFTVGIQFDAERIDIEAPIIGENGQVLYYFVCRGGDYDT